MHISLELIVIEMQRFTVLCDEITLDYQIADKDPRRCRKHTCKQPGLIAESGTQTIL